MLAFVKDSRRRAKKKFDWSVSHKEWLRVLQKSNALSVSTRSEPANRRQNPPVKATRNSQEATAAAPHTPQSAAAYPVNGRRPIRDTIAGGSESRRAPSPEDIPPTAGPSNQGSSPWINEWLASLEGRGFRDVSSRRRVAQILEKAGVRELYQIEHLADNLGARDRVLAGLKAEMSLYELSTFESMLDARRS